MHLKTLAISVAAATISLSAFAAGSKVGVVNVETIFNTAPQGHASLLKIQSKMAPQIQTLKKEQASIEAHVKSVERNAPTMTKAQKSAKEKSLATQQQGFQQKVMALRSSEMKMEQTAAKKFSTDLKASTKAVAAKQDLTVILTSQAAPYYVSSADVTSAVAAQMKKMS